MIRDCDDLPFPVFPSHARRCSASAGVLTVQFSGDPETRRALIRKLFTGAYHHDVEEVDVPHVLTGLARVVFS